MKKLFTLIASAFVAVAASAQVISFSETASAGDLDGKEFANGNFKITITDTGAKVSVDANSAYFGTSGDDKVSFDYRLKTGGKSSSKNMITVTVPSDGTLKIYARTGSNSATDRDIIVTQNETAVLDQILLESAAATETYTKEDGTEATRSIYPIYSAAVTAGTATITYPVGSVNFYAFEFVSSAPSGGTWTKTGIAVPYSNWTGYVDSTYIGEKFTIEGDEVAKTIKVTDKWGYSYTFAEGAGETIASIDGQTFSGTYDYFGAYFMYGDYYYGNFTPNYDSYVSTDEVSGYLMLSGYFYKSQTDYQWGYLYITWDDAVVESTKQIEWSAVGEVRKSTAAINYEIYVTEYLVPGDEKPAIISYNDGSYKVASFAGVKGYDLNFTLQGDSAIYVTDCTDTNKAGTLARVATGLTDSDKYGRFGIYFNGHACDDNQYNLDKNHGYINLRYGVGYTNSGADPSTGKYPFASYSLVWYNYPESVNAQLVMTDVAADSTGTYVETECPIDTAAFSSTRNLYYFSSDSLYVIPEYLGPGTGDLEFKVVTDSLGYTVLEIEDVALGGYGDGYDYWELSDDETDYLGFVTYHDSEYDDYYSYLNGDMTSGYTYFHMWRGQTDYITYKLLWGDEITAIKSVNTTDTTSPVATDYRIYDLNGRVLSAKPAKGMYIQNGKKYLAK